MKPQSLIDHRKLKLNNRVAGWWFSKRTNWTKGIELVGKSFALTLRIALRRNVGTETFSLSAAIIGCLLIRLFTSISISKATESKALDHVFNLLAFHNIETGILNSFSVLFTVACIWYFVRTELYHPSMKQDPPNVLGRGESRLLAPLIDENKSVFRSEGFVQAWVAPVLILGIGAAIWHFQIAVVLGIYLMVSSVFLMVDETLYHRASERQFRLLMADENRLKKKRDKYERHRRNARNKK